MAWEGIPRALWLFLPAYVANMAPVFMAKIVPAWRSPIDGGHVAKDGQRVLGAGKTWRGLAGGALLGGLVALTMAWLAPHWSLIEGWDFGLNGYERGARVGPQAICVGDPADCVGYIPSAPWQVFLFGAIVGFMALVGDAVKSYFKRRRGKPGGAPWFPFDQLDFVVFGLLGFIVAAPILPHGWVMHALTDDWVVPATIVVLTPALHLLVNRIGFWLGLKKVPW